MLVPMEGNPQITGWEVEVIPYTLQITKAFKRHCSGSDVSTAA